jgi:outer membrane protein assembly factor BamB
VSVNPRQLFRASPVIVTCWLTMVGFSCSLRAQWPGFLGEHGNPVITQELIPDEFVVGQENQPAVNIAWRRPITGRSVGGPIVVKGRIITTSSSAMEGRWGATVAVDAQTGNVLWQRSIKTTGRPYCHPLSANAAPTPCTDGQRVFAFFSSNDLVCYDLDGNLQWFRSLVDTHPLAGNDVGMSSSPAVAEGVVVTSVECQGDSFLAGIDAETGTTLWEVPRPRKANWSSPVVAVGADGQPLFVSHSSQNVVGIVPRTGKIAWELDEKCSSIVSGACVDGILYLPAGGVKAFQLGNSDQKPVLAWSTNKVNSSSSSLAIVKGFGVVGLKGGVLSACNPQGELKWQTRLPEADQIWSTPIVAGKRLLIADTKGNCFIVDLKDEKAEVVSVSKLGCEVLGTPAADSTGIYIRSVDAVWKVQKL